MEKAPVVTGILRVVSVASVTDNSHNGANQSECADETGCHLHLREPVEPGARLEAIIVDRNCISKHNWRAEIVLATTDCHDANEIHEIERHFKDAGNSASAAKASRSSSG